MEKVELSHIGRSCFPPIIVSICKCFSTHFDLSQVEEVVQLQGSTPTKKNKSYHSLKSFSTRFKHFQAFPTSPDVYCFFLIIFIVVVVVLLLLLLSLFSFLITSPDVYSEGDVDIGFWTTVVCHTVFLARNS